MYMRIHVHEFMNMYIHVCTMFRHVCTVFQYPVHGGRIPDGEGATAHIQEYFGTKILTEYDLLDRVHVHSLIVCTFYNIVRQT